MYFHGGGFVACGLRTHRRMIARISQAAGMPVLSVAYRMPPRVIIQRSIGDCVDAYRWLLDKGYEGGDIVIGGDSAGGYLAFMAPLHALREGLPRPAGIAAPRHRLRRSGGRVVLAGLVPFRGGRARLALTPIKAFATGPNLRDSKSKPWEPGSPFMDWAARDMLPKWAQKLALYRPTNPITLRARRASLYLALNGLHEATGPLPESRQAQARVAKGTTTQVASTAPTAPDPVLTREEVEATA